MWGNRLTRCKKKTKANFDTLAQLCQGPGKRKGRRSWLSPKEHMEPDGLGYRDGSGSHCPGLQFSQKAGSHLSLSRGRAMPPVSSSGDKDKPGTNWMSLYSGCPGGNGTSWYDPGCYPTLPNKKPAKVLKSYCWKTDTLLHFKQIFKSKYKWHHYIKLHQCFIFKACEL